ncbi:hypothetical protein [Chitinophaga silvisoli]|uniref:Uncharacterized protein n=1 Tax=Chitinophaga silvisoli TaxID=2291814 RepID=A0A3E1NZ18_9BACT|nr:hypothetical protein [Chitinophaga silvisoli]RFM33162.1 hypothetical protein DXN04_19215 [Chitinophaga silvisoli]
MDIHYGPKFTEIVDPFLAYVDPLPRPWMYNVEGEDKQRLKDLLDKHRFLAPILKNFVRNPFMTERDMPKLPIINNFKPNIPLSQIEAIVPKEILNAEYYDDLMNAVKAYCNPIVAEFDKLKEKYCK